MKRLVLLFLFLTAAFAFRGTLLPPIARFLNVSSDCELPVEYVVPPPGDDNTRTLAAAALVRNGYAEKVAVLRGAASPSELDGVVPPSSEITRRVLVARGIDERRITALDGVTASTLEDMALLSQLWEKTPNARVAIVSNGYHLRRLRWSVHRVLPEQASLVSYVAAPMDGYDESDWWCSEGGLSSVLSEYLKLIFYVARYGSVGQRIILLAPLLAILLGFCGWINVRRKRAYTPSSSVSDASLTE